MDTGDDGNLLPIHDLCKVKSDVDLEYAHTINLNVKLEACTGNEIKQ